MSGRSPRVLFLFLAFALATPGTADQTSWLRGPAPASPPGPRFRLVSPAPADSAEVQPEPASLDPTYPAQVRVESGTPFEIKLPSLVSTVAFSASGEVLVVAESRGELHFFDFPSGRLLGTTGLKAKHGEVLDLAVSPSEARLAVITRDGRLSILGIPDPQADPPRLPGVLLLSEPKHPDLASVSYTLDGTGLVTGARDGSLHHWNLSSRSSRDLEAPKGGGASKVLITRTGQLVVGVGIAPSRASELPGAACTETGAEGGLYLGSPETGVEVRLPGGRSPITAMAATPDGRSLLVARLDTGLEIWDLPARSRGVLRTQRKIRGHPLSWWRTATAHDDNQVFVGGGETWIQHLRVEDGRDAGGFGHPVPRWPARSELRSLVYSPDGSWLALAAGNQVDFVDGTNH